MRLPVRCLSIAACVAGMSVGAVRGEQVDNPAYKAWAKFSPGTTVTYKQTTEMNIPNMPAGMGGPSMTMTQKLIDVKPDAATIEVSITSSFMGRENKMAPQTQQVAAKIDKEKEGLPASGVKGEVKDVKEGSEKVEVNGKSVDAHTREFTVVATEPQPMTAHIKIWSTEDVPGGMVKTVTDTVEPMKSTSTMALVDFTIAK